MLFVVSFSENNINIYEELRRQDLSCRTVFLVNKKEYPLLKKYQSNNCSVLLFEPASPIQFIKGIFHLATSKVIFVDNYFGFLSAIKLKEEVQCIQLWHANGAIKKFGLKDPSIENRTDKAKIRFKKVYNQFKKVIVGSDEMLSIFKEAFAIEDERFLKTGVPRTDTFFNIRQVQAVKQELYLKFPYLNGKKVILYAPTFRDENLESYEIQLNFDLMKTKLGPDYILLLKLHPAIKNRVPISANQADFVYDVSGYSQTNHLLFITDYLITDYSSIPFEFALLEKPMIFFPYDLKHYQKTRGIWGDYHKAMPGPIVLSTNEIINVILANNFNQQEIIDFKDKWNKYSDGKSCRRIVDYIENKL